MRWTWLTSGRYNALLVAGALFAFFSLTASDWFLSPGNLQNVARQVSLDAPVVLGQTIVLITGGIDISVGATMAMSAAIAIGFQPYGIGVAVAAALLFGCAVGLVNGLLVTKGRIVPFVATLGTMSVVRGILLTYTKQQPLSGIDEGFTWLGAGNIGPFPVPMLFAVGVALILALLLAKTRTGRSLYAVGGNTDGAYLAGISVMRIQLLAYTASGLLAALSGVLLASRLNMASIQLGNDTPLLTITAALIGGASLLGGRGTVMGALLGVLALGMLTNGMNLLGVETYVQIATKAVLLVLVVVADAMTRNMAARRSPHAARSA